MANKYFVYEIQALDRPHYLRVDEQGVHWMESNKSFATPLPYKKALNIARINNQSAIIGGYTPRWGTERIL